MGVADLSDVPESPYPLGICYMMPVPRHIIKDLLEAPTKEYHQMYLSHNQKLNEMGEKVASLLQDKGYNALANTSYTDPSAIELTTLENVIFLGEFRFKQLLKHIYII